MHIASWLLMTASLVTPAGQQPQQTPRPVSGTQQSQSQPHQLGLGAAVTMTNRGARASVRYWFGNHIGVNMQASWYRAGSLRSVNPLSGTVTDTSLGSTFQAMPSLTVIFGQSDPDKVVS